MMSTSKQFNDFIKFKKIYCLLVQQLLFAGGEAALGGPGGGFSSEVPSPAAPSAAKFRLQSGGWLSRPE